MTPTEVLFACAAALFVFSFFRICARLWEFATYGRSYGTAPSISLDEIVALAEEKDREIPAFTVFVPALEETETISETMRRVAAVNYPRTHIDLVVVTYADEAPNAAGQTTADLARSTAAEINAAAGRPLAIVEDTPAGFDGFFPGDFDTGELHRGKARGLNHSLRRLHERIEADERAYALGRFIRAGQISRVDDALDAVAAAAGSPEQARALCRRCFTPGQPGYVGPPGYSRQVARARDLAAALGPETGADLAAFAARMEPRFDLEQGAEPDSAFLAPIVAEVEARAPEELEAYSRSRDERLRRERPLLARKLAALDDPEALWPLARRLNTRWVAVFDADAEPPPDLFRHLAARILVDDEVMALQGPVAPLANLGQVHPICGLGALWIAFSHATIFPRLMTRPRWARPLAGTNWCMRIEGMESDGRLARSPGYQEARRRFLLSFDPRQLTEDLELGLRLYSEWRIAAEWHPYLEWEQAAPRPRDLVRQWTRWTQGTLQAGTAMMGSNLPLLQKMRFALLPFEISFAGFGPALTVILWGIVLTGGFQIDPVLKPLTVFLTCINIFYVVPFIVALMHFRHIRKRDLVGEAVLETGGLLPGPQEDHAVAALREAFDEAGIRNAAQVARLTREYVQARHVDLARPGRPAHVQRYFEETPTAVSEQRTAALLDRLAEADYGALTDRRRRRSGGSGSIRKVLFWSIPFLLFQLIPYFRGMAKWMFGTDRTWIKTPRTPRR